MEVIGREQDGATGLIKLLEMSKKSLFKSGGYIFTRLLEIRSMGSWLYFVES